MKATPMIGERVGMLVVVSATDQRRRRGVVYKCQCDCGKEVLRNGIDLRVYKKRGFNSSCGCMKAEIATANAMKGIHKAIAARTTHRLSHHPIYRSWTGMMRRCHKPSDVDYRHYGGRGIVVCKEWHDRTKFFEWAKTGWAPGLTIDRIDVNGNYEPINCRWATRAEQSQNTRVCKRYIFKGQSVTLSEISAMSGVQRDTLRHRIGKLGLSPDMAVAMPNRYGDTRKKKAA